MFHCFTTLYQIFLWGFFYRSTKNTWSNLITNIKQIQPHGCNFALSSKELFGAWIGRSSSIKVLSQISHYNGCYSVFMRISKHPVETSVCNLWCCDELQQLFWNYCCGIFPLGAWMCLLNVMTVWLITFWHIFCTKVVRDFTATHTNTHSSM